MDSDSLFNSNHPIQCRSHWNRIHGSRRNHSFTFHSFHFFVVQTFFVRISRFILRVNTLVTRPPATLEPCPPAAHSRREHVSDDCPHARACKQIDERIDEKSKTRQCFSWCTVLRHLATDLETYGQRDDCDKEDEVYTLFHRYDFLNIGWERISLRLPFSIIRLCVSGVKTFYA